MGCVFKGRRAGCPRLTRLRAIPKRRVLGGERIHLQSCLLLSPWSWRMLSPMAICGPWVVCRGTWA